MMIALGNFLFHYRNGLFPLFYALLLFRSPPLLGNYRMALCLGLLIALTGQLLRALTIGLEYIIRGGRGRRVYAEKLVTGGLFAHCRNPLYIGNFIILLGVGVASNSTLFLGVAMPFFALAYWAIIVAEENYLRGKFGEEFNDYCMRVNRIIPNLSGIRQTLVGMRFNWRRLITAEYGLTFIWITAIILVTLKNLWLRGEYETARATVWALWTLLIIVMLAYALARFLKKSGLLRSEVKPGSSPLPSEPP
jgi:protein-S-isoprenylcysteine O-methyltransferase Ste14